MHHDLYAYWRALVDGAHVPFVDAPQAGFWRSRRGKGAGYIPIAIWPEDGELRAAYGTQLYEPWRVWSIGIEATTEAAYRAKVQGRPYPDEYLTASGETTTDISKVGGLIRPRRPDGNQASKAAAAEKPDGD